MIVVDTNVVAYLLLTGEYSLAAEQALQKNSHWVAPLLWRSEFRNVLALYLRKKLLPLANANAVMALGLELFRGREYDVASEDVLRLAVESGLPAYDCEFVVLARDLAVPLITSDKQLARAFPDAAILLEAFVS